MPFSSRGVIKKKREETPRTAVVVDIHNSLQFANSLSEDFDLVYYEKERMKVRMCDKKPNGNHTPT
jgi:hypothetical protein